MIVSKIIFNCILFAHLALAVFAQDTGVVPHPALTLEARVTTYVQGGYDLGMFYYPRNSRFSFGALVAGHDINGTAKELLFTSNNHDGLTLRLSWIVSLQTRFHFAKHKEGVFAELGIGMEEFSITSGNKTHHNMNGFIAPTVGYMWFPWQRAGFYALPKVASVFILFREDEQMIHETRYQLRAFFPSPSVAIGWKF